MESLDAPLQQPDKSKGGFDPLLDASNKIVTHEPVKEEKKPGPYYTLPVGATLTGATAMQPLVGRLPINGRVMDPLEFKAIIGPKNLAANGVYIPSDIQGIIVRGVATGDMLASSVTGSIISITFVFQDGRISTTEAKSGESLGEIADEYGNPMIRGEFHSNAGLALGGTSLLAGMQGYANALSQAQTQSSITNGASINTIIKDGNKYAMGQAGASAAASAQDWWRQRIQNTYDYVFVPNVDLKTKALLKLNINLTKQIEINYDPYGRKVFYAHTFNEATASQLD